MRACSDGQAARTLAAHALLADQTCVSHRLGPVCVSVCVYLCVCVFVCVCVPTPLTCSAATVKSVRTSFSPSPTHLLVRDDALIAKKRALASCARAYMTHTHTHAHTHTHTHTELCNYPSYTHPPPLPHTPHTQAHTFGTMPRTDVPAGSMVWVVVLSSAGALMTWTHSSRDGTACAITARSSTHTRIGAQTRRGMAWQRGGA